MRRQRRAQLPGGGSGCDCSLRCLLLLCGRDAPSNHRAVLLTQVKNRKIQGLSRAASIWRRRTGRNTNHAISAAMAFITDAAMNTPCQPPDIATSTLDSGTSSDAVPLAV